MEDTTDEAMTAADTQHSQYNIGRPTDRPTTHNITVVNDVAPIQYNIIQPMLYIHNSVDRVDLSAPSYIPPTNTSEHSPTYLEKYLRKNTKPGVSRRQNRHKGDKFGPG